MRTVYEIDIRYRQSGTKLDIISLDNFNLYIFGTKECRFEMLRPNTECYVLLSNQHSYELYGYKNENSFLLVELKYNFGDYQEDIYRCRE